MTKLFQLIEIKNEQGISEKNISLGIQVKIGEQTSIVPVTSECRSVGALTREVKTLQKELEDTLERAKDLFERKPSGGGMEITEDMTPPQVWSVLSAISGEEPFAEGFNSMAEERRREVAEYILTSCNIFSGKAAVFSARYDSDTALLE
jgi:hypothetical protein